ncbi:MAG: tetratricopeptide repeat protein [Nitrospirae bacterium]|nr:tetratricopeptide repeat protein [Nitrospirota bacterium]
MRGGGVLLLSILLLTSCARENIEIIRDKEVKSATEEILTFQDRPQEKTLEYRWKAVKAYEEFIGTHRGDKSEIMANSMHQLADIYMEIEENSYLKKKGKFDHSMSRELYKEILRLYPDRDENEAILYQLARGYTEEGRWDDSITLLEKMVKDYPNGKFSQEASFRLGEYFYRQGQISKAIYYYRQVLKKDDFNLYDKALYKLGWVLFQSKEYEGAADRFINLLERRGVRLTPEGREETGELSVVENDMVWDAIRTLVLVFDYMGGTSRIADYFKVRGVQGFEPYIYRRLGDIYLETGRFKEAADIYEVFIKTNPFHEDAPLFQSKIVESHIRGNMLDLAFNARVKLVETYREDSVWFKANRRSAQRRAKDIVQLNKKMIKTDLYNLAVYYYSRARSSKKKEDFAEAITWLQRYPYNFPEESESIELNFILAEILFEMKEYGRAAAEYERVAYQFSPSQFSAEAGYDILLSMEKLARPSGQLLTGNKYTIKLAEECRRFVKTFPQDKRVPEALLNGAEIFFQSGRFEESREMAQQLTGHDSSTEREKYLAQRLIAESFLKEEAYNRSEEEIRKAITLIPESERKDLPLLERALAASLYKQAEELRSQGKIPEAAGAFLKVYNTVPGTDIAPVALYDAGILYEQVKEWDKAIKTYEILYQKYPGSQYAFSAAVQWAEILVENNEYIKAVSVYEKAAGLATDKGLKEEASYKALTMYEKSGNLSELYNNYYKSYERFLMEFPESPRLIELTFKVANIRDSVKDFGNAKVLYERVIALHKRLGANADLETTATAARAQLILGDNRNRLFEGVKLIHPLEENLKRKEDILRDALTDYTSAAKYRISEVTTEATYKMGEMLEHLRNAILESERPLELTPEQLEEYNFMLEEQAYPFEEKAVTTYESNVRRTIEAGIYDSWAKKSYERLSILLPARYKRVETGERYNGDISSVISDDPDTYNRLGILYRENGEFKKAEENYLKGVSIRAGFSDSFLNLGILYELYLGRLEDALKNYKEYVRLGGSRGDVLSWIEMLEKRIGVKQ